MNSLAFHIPPRNSSLVIPACFRMFIKVPLFIWPFIGTTTRSVFPSIFLCREIWLPLCLTTENPPSTSSESCLKKREAVSSYPDSLTGISALNIFGTETPFFRSSRVMPSLSRTSSIISSSSALSR